MRKFDTYFYWFALVENDFPDIKPQLQMLLIVAMLLDDDESILDQIPKSHIAPLSHWLSETILNEKVMKLDQWYEMAFHLCKQRFDSTMEWMENQPMPKLLLMTNTVTKFAKEQEREMRKARRKK
jgi:hypothetical protein